MTKILKIIVAGLVCWPALAAADPRVDQCFAEQPAGTEPGLARTTCECMVKAIRDRKDQIEIVRKIRLVGATLKDMPPETAKLVAHCVPTGK